MNDTDVTQYFIDGTYKCVQNIIKSPNVLIIVIAYNDILQKFVLCIVFTFTKEDKDMFIQFYILLKAKYNFNQKRLICDFSKANIEPIKNLYGEGKINIINSGFGYNNKIINESQFKKLKLKPDEGTIFNDNMHLIYQLIIN